MAIAIVLITILMAYSPQPPISKTGAPGESNCASCHTTPNANYDGFISLNGLPTEIVANQTYALTLNVISTDTRPDIGGFQLVALDSANNNAGIIELVNFTNTSFQASSSGKEYVGHKNAMPFANSDTIAWSFNWTAPSSTSSVTFYSSALLADGMNGNTGDNTLTFSETHAISAPLDIEVVIDNVIEPHCYEGTNGVAHATVLNGMQPYSYLWSTGDTLAWVYTLGAGTHSVTVTDANDKVATQSINIGQPDEIIPAISASSLIIPCGESVTLHASASGGTGPLTYSWNTGAGDIDSIVVTQSGYYCLVVTDSNQCQEVVCVGVNLDQTGIFCNGITADSITCSIPTSTLYSGVTASDTISYTWTGPNGFVSNDPHPQITVGGIYTLVATIPTGCSCTSNINVLDLTDFELQITELTSTSCYNSQDGAIDVDVLSGAYAPFTTIPPNFDGDSLGQGNYSVTVTNGVGCSTVVDFIIDGPDSINTIANIVDIAGSTPGAINITTTGGTPNYSYSWTPLDTNVIIGTDGSLTNITTPGDYYLDVTDMNDCNITFGPFTVGLIDFIEDVAFSNSISISPNPANDFIVITQKDKLVTLDVLLYSINNKLINKYHFSERENSIDLSALPSGIYQVVLKSDTKLASKQIIVRK